MLDRNPHFVNRGLWVLIHRWAGLAMAGFLILVGLSGSLLAFYRELERALNPHWYVEREPALWRDAASLVERLEADDPRARVVGLAWQDYAGASSARISATTNPETGQPFTLEYRHVVFRPGHGSHSGSNQRQLRGWQRLPHGFRLLVTLLPGARQLRCLGARYRGAGMDGGLLRRFLSDLTAREEERTSPPAQPPVGTRRGHESENAFPPRRSEGGSGWGDSCASGRGSARGWWQRWKPAWKIRWRAGGYKLNFDLHRAGGLWLWAMLLVFAWSSVAMDLWNTVYTWTTRAFLEYRPDWTELRPLEQPLAAPGMSWREAQATGDRLMSEQARRWGFRVLHPVELAFDADRGVFEYRVRTNCEIEDRSRYWGSTRLFFSAADGSLRHFMLPRGQYAGNTLTNWLYALHMANVFGLPYRIFVCVLGLLIAMLSVTGVIIWLRKRRAGTARVAAPRGASRTSPALERARS